jgi:hypothetical protein
MGSLAVNLKYSFALEPAFKRKRVKSLVPNFSMDLSNGASCIKPGYICPTLQGKLPTGSPWCGRTSHQGAGESESTVSNHA